MNILQAATNIFTSTPPPIRCGYGSYFSWVGTMGQLYTLQIELVRDGLKYQQGSQHDKSIRIDLLF